MLHIVKYYSVTFQLETVHPKSFFIYIDYLRNFNMKNAHMTFGHRIKLNKREPAYCTSFQWCQVRKAENHWCYSLQWNYAFVCERASLIGFTIFLCLKSSITVLQLFFSNHRLTLKAIHALYKTIYDRLRNLLKVDFFKTYVLFVVGFLQCWKRTARFSARASHLAITMKQYSSTLPGNIFLA